MLNFWIAFAIVAGLVGGFMKSCTGCESKKDKEDGTKEKEAEPKETSFLQNADSMEFTLSDGSIATFSIV